MQCPVCRDKDNKPTGHLELVSALSITLGMDGTLTRTSAVLLDEYLSCNNCADTECESEDCVGWHWEQNGNDRRVKLEAEFASSTASLMTT